MPLRLKSPNFVEEAENVTKKLEEVDVRVLFFCCAGWISSSAFLKSMPSPAVRFCIAFAEEVDVRVVLLDGSVHCLRSCIRA